MAFEAYIEKIVGLEAMKNVFPDLICDDLLIFNTWAGIRTTFKHRKNTFWRTQIYLHEVIDDTKLVNVLYRHKGTDRSGDELETILNSFEYTPLE